MSQVFKPEWATADPSTMGVGAPHIVANLVAGKWTTDTKATMTIPDPMDKNSQPIFTIPDTQVDELEPFFKSLRAVPKSGIHNPLKNPDRYVQYGEISRKVRNLTTRLPIEDAYVLTLSPCYFRPVTLCLPRRLPTISLDAS